MRFSPCIHGQAAGSADLAHEGIFLQQEFFQFYMETNRSKPSADEENKMDMLKKGA